MNSNVPSLASSRTLRIALYFIMTLPSLALGQNNLDASTATGESPLAVYKAGDIDHINPVNGNVYLNIPLLSYPQMGHSLRLAFRIYSNDKQWTLNTTGYPQNPSGLPTGKWALSAGNGPGVYVARDQYLDFGADYVSRKPETGGSDATAWTLNTQITWNYVRSSDGAKHFYSDHQDQSSNGPYPLAINSVGTSYPAVDGSGYNPIGNLAVKDRDGVTYTAGGDASTLETVQDTSNNRITSTASGWLDTLLRPFPGTTEASTSIDPGYLLPSLVIPGDPIPGIPVTPPPSCSSQTMAAREWAVPSLDRGTQTYIFCYADFKIKTMFYVNAFFRGVDPYVWNCLDINDGKSARLLSAIILPNGRSYGFDYDSFLSLKTITLPTGATISYTWQNLAFSDSNYSTPVSRALLSRTVDPGGNQLPRTWQYHWTTIRGDGTYLKPSDNDSIWSVITDPSGNDEEHQISYGSSGPREGGVTNYQGCGPHNPSCTVASPALKNVAYSNFVDGGPAANDMIGINNGPAVFFAPQIPLDTTTTLYRPDGSTQVSKETKTLTPLYGTCSAYQGLGTKQSQQLVPILHPQCYQTNQVASSAIYDYGEGSPGNLLRTTSMTYAWQNALTGPTYIDANLLNLTDTTTVFAGTQTDPMLPASGTKVAQTTFAYDESPSPNLVAYGNLTSMTKLGSSIRTSRTVYNGYGMPTDSYDPKSKHTHYDYDGTNLFLSKITYPATTGVSHSVGFTFDKNTGLILSKSDQNQNATIYSYIDPGPNAPDPMNRLHSIKLPATYDGSSCSTGSGQTTYSYNDAPSSLSVKETVTQNSSGTKATFTTTYFDNLGEVTKATTSGQQIDSISSDTSYDLSGRVYQVSNLYTGGGNSVSSGSIPLTTYTYDGLGRKGLQSQQDQSSQVWTYSGASTLFTDESLNKWSRQYDALGRLVSVTEHYPGSSTAQNAPSEDPNNVHCGLVCRTTYPDALVTTSYVYDALDNLIRVKQPGLPSEMPRTDRTFQYDSFSELLWASNPESGLVCYGMGDGTQSGCQANGYDANGNLQYKTDARGVITSYFYDDLNRLTNKTYSGASVAASLIAARTPPSAYTYDNGVGTTVSNAVGRLVAETTGLSNSLTSYRALLGYDAMGRILGDQQCVLGSLCGAPTQYTYDLAGHTTSSSSGVGTGGLGFNYAYDAVGRLQTLSSTWSDSSHPRTLFGPPTSGSQYGPVGLVAANLGVFASSQQPTYSQVRTYDNRQRLFSETNQKAASGGTLVYSYVVGFTPNSNIQSLTDSVMGNWTYGYDFQNRLVSAQASPNADTNYAPYGSGILTWVYDSFGNYKGQTLTGTTQAMVNQGTYAYDVNNRSLDTPPDASGNLPQAGNSSFTYDAEGRVDTANGQVSYIYDAEGRRVAKGIQTAGSGGTTSVTLTNMYLLGLGGGQLSETDGQGNWLHTNAFSSGKMLATYDSRGLHFHFTDWLGSRRIQASGTGQIEETCQNLPFGDSLNCLGSGVDATEHHFTGKERDAESGLDYFGARYYASSTGRFISPDWSAQVEAVPYARLDNPQSLNLYTYVGNNPLSGLDPDGHIDCSGDNASGAGCQSIATRLTQQEASANAWASAGFGEVSVSSSGGMYSAQQQGGLKGPFGVPKSGPIRDEFEKDAKSGAKGFIGDKWCVTACKHFAPGLENYSTPHWRPGDPASGLTAADRGTAIATFVNDRFENGGDQNSAIYLGPGPTPGSIVVLDQFPHPSHPPGPRLIEPDSSTGHVISNSAQYYHVILVQP